MLPCPKAREALPTSVSCSKRLSQFPAETAGGLALPVKTVLSPEIIAGRGGSCNDFLAGSWPARPGISSARRVNLSSHSGNSAFVKVLDLSESIRATAAPCLIPCHGGRRVAFLPALSGQLSPVFPRRSRGICCTRQLFTSSSPRALLITWKKDVSNSLQHAERKAPLPSQWS